MGLPANRLANGPKKLAKSPNQLGREPKNLGNITEWITLSRNCQVQKTCQEQLTG
ncbi:hypothetical protein SD074_25790 [Prolixibacter sp. SD074]|jgi:hypothetical protein|nr:hypothetical protein SD074_25790 [Prolixibacter sp. SD074]